MNGAKFMQGWMSLTGSAAMFALILTAFGIMLGIVKPADALTRVGTILGVVIVLILIPGFVMSAWSGLSLWQRVGLVAIGIGFSQWLLRPRRNHSWQRNRGLFR